MRKRYVVSGLVASALLAVGYQQYIEYQQEQQQAAVRQKIADQAAKLRKEDEELRAKFQDEVKDYFYYNQLSEEEQANYLRLLVGLRQFDNKINLSSQNEVRNTRVFLAVAYDNPEFYWLSETKYSIDFWSMTYPEEAKAIQKQLHTIADEVIAKMPQGSDYEKVKYIYEYIIQNTEYNLSALDNEDVAWANQSIRSVFLDKKSICNGYSLAFQFLCQKAGIESIYIAGDISASVDKHAWNLVKIDGKYYPIDTTWGDPTFSAEVAGQQQLSSIDYSYLCMPKALFEKTHVADETFFENEGPNAAYLSDSSEPFVYPSIEASGLNYYQLNGGYFDTYEPTTIASYLVEQLRSNKTATLQIGLLKDYERFVADLESGKADYLHDYLSQFASYQGYSYVRDPLAQTVIIQLM